MTIRLRSARPADVRAIAALVEPYARERLVIKKALISYFEDIQEFVVAVKENEVVGCGALHVLWDDIAEVRTMAVKPGEGGQGIGGLILEELLSRARSLGLRRVFCLTFETRFFARFGFVEIDGTPVGVDVYAQMVHSHDDGVAEFLDLARVKPNTLGNTRMIVELDAPRFPDYPDARQMRKLRDRRLPLIMENTGSARGLAPETGE